MITLHHVCLFLPHKRGKDDELAHLVCRVKWNACRSVVSLNLGYVIDPDKWDSQAQCCQLRSTHGALKIPAATINREIQRYRDAARKVFEAFAQDDCWPTPDEVRGALRVELGLDAPELLTTADVYRKFCTEESITKSWSADTVGKMRTTGDHIQSFEPFRVMSGFTSMNLALYLEHLRTERRLCDSTIQRHLSNVKWFLKWAEKKRYLSVTDYKDFHPKIKAVAPPIIYLTWDELMKVWNYQTDDELLRQTVDFFLFCCFTSLRWSDCHNLKWSDLSAGELTTIKTVDKISITLNKWSDEILSRYIDVAFPGDYVFCRTCNQVMNRQLKKVMKDLEINTPYTLVSYKGSQRVEEVKEKWQLVGTHTGRKTFICNSLILGIPPTIVMQWTGHSDYDSMKPYIAVTDQSKAEAMSVFDRLRDTMG